MARSNESRATSPQIRELWADGSRLTNSDIHAAPFELLSTYQKEMNVREPISPKERMEINPSGFRCRHVQVSCGIIVRRARFESQGKVAAWISLYQGNPEPELKLRSER